MQKPSGSYCLIFNLKPLNTVNNTPTRKGRLHGTTDSTNTDKSPSYNKRNNVSFRIYDVLHPGSQMGQVSPKITPVLPPTKFVEKRLGEQGVPPRKNKASPLVVEKPNQSTRGTAVDLHDCSHIDYRCRQSGMGAHLEVQWGAGYLDSTRETTLIQLQGTQSCSQRNLSIPKSAQRPTYTGQIGEYNFGSVPRQTRRDQKSHLDEYSA